MSLRNDQRMDRNAGIAIGPILFIIAIMAILAAAIAAGSGSFTGNTMSEGHKVKASALIQIGGNLKMGMDQLTLSVGVPLASISFDPAETNTNQGLFSPTGGGISPPSPSMANDPVNDKWFYPTGTGISGFGGASSTIALAILSIPFGVCSEVNNRVFGVPGVPAADLGITLGGTPMFADNVAWPVASATWTTAVKPDGTVVSTSNNTPSMVGSATGCIQDSLYDGTVTGASTNYFFYQVLAIQ